LPPPRVLAQTSFICAGDVAAGCNADNAMARLHAEQDRVDVHLDQVPAVLVQAVLSAEDRDFFAHGGVDPVGILRAAWSDIRNKSAVQGGSTITQQYVKNVYLSDERTLSRKLKEAVLAVKLEQKLSKEEILERYLNTVYFGRGAYGVGAAARSYFGLAVGDLNLAQAAYLAGLIRAPEAADATRDPAEASRRRLTVLDAMLEEKYITQAERDAANAVPWDGYVLPRAEAQAFGDVKGAEYGTEYFVSYVRQQLLAKGFTDAEIYSGGLRVYTTLDFRLQQAAYTSITGTLDQPDDPQAALVAIDPTGRIVAMVGGRDFRTNEVNYALGTGFGGAGRQAGSAMKPFVLAQAVRDGISVESKFEAPGEVVIPKANAGEDWTVHNYGNESFETMNLIDATRLSVNTVYAQLMRAVAPQPVVDLAVKMGVTSPLDPVPALVLGAEEVSVLDLASAYSTFADGGTHVQPVSILRVERQDGSIVTFDQPRTEVFTRQETNIVTYCLRQVVLGGTGRGANPGVPVAGKTGTTQNNIDAWFVGFAPNGFTTAVWMGYDPIVNPDGSKTARYMNDVHGRAVTGGSFPATIWKQFMEVALEGVDVGSFNAPSSFPGERLNPELDTTTTTVETTTTSESTTTTTADTTSSSTSTTVGSTTSVTLGSTTSTTVQPNGRSP
jgi:penicillin-binding protein 1A